MMATFPKSKLVPTKAKLSGQPGDVSIEIYLEPFELAVEDYSENVDTSIRLDSVNVPIEPESLEGKTFQFPVNPAPGYIDGSIYFFAAHNPIDVTEIRFGEIENRKLPIELACSWQLEFERTGFENFESTVKTQLEL